MDFNVTNYMYTRRKFRKPLGIFIKYNTIAIYSEYLNRF